MRSDFVVVLDPCVEQSKRLVARTNALVVLGPPRLPEESTRGCAVASPRA